MSLKIIDGIGGKKNINSHYHCMTRLRINIKDPSKLDMKKLREIEGVLGTAFSSDTLQLVIGNAVHSLYPIFNEIVPTSNENVENSSSKKVKKGKVSAVLESIAGIFGPIIPCIAGAGIFKTVLLILTTLHLISDTTETYKLLYIGADVVFYFLPFLIAYSAAKVFKTDILLSIAITSALFYPTILDALSKGTQYMHLLGVPVKIVNSASSVIPVILSVWLLKYVYKFIDKLIPDVLKLFLTPFFTLIIMVTIELVLFAPLGSYLGTGMAAVITYLVTHAKLLTGLVLGGLWIPLVVTGMHHAIVPLIFQELATNKATILMPLTNMANIALAGGVMAVYLKTKNQKLKAIAGSAVPSVALGITEPGIYGVAIENRKVFYGTILGGAIGGAYITSFNVVQYIFGGLGIFTPLLNLANPKLIHYIIATVLSFLISFIFSYITHKDAATSSENLDNKPFNTPLNKNYQIKSPLIGNLVSLKDVPDKLFSQEVMGKGVAIEPTRGEIICPFDGTVEVVANTKHALGLKSSEGVDLIIHIGIDTVKLDGKYFNIKVSQGDKVKAGDLLGTFDIAKIREKGYSLITPIVITNTADYVDVLPNREVGTVIQEDNILELISFKHQNISA